jgi:hypothetical protein
MVCRGGESLRNDRAAIEHTHCSLTQAAMRAHHAAYRVRTDIVSPFPGCTGWAFKYPPSHRRDEASKYREDRFPLPNLAGSVRNKRRPVTPLTGRFLFVFFLAQRCLRNKLQVRILDIA